MRDDASGLVEASYDPEHDEAPWQELEPSAASAVSLALLGLMVVLAGTVAGVLLSGLAPTLYGARAEFVVYTSPSDPTASGERVATQMSILSSQAVFEAAARQFDTDVRGLRERVEVESAAEGSSVTLTTADRDPQRALGITQALVKQYGTALSATFSTDPVSQYLEAEIERLQAKRGELADQVERATGSERSALDAQLRVTDDAVEAVEAEVREVRDAQLSSATALHLVSLPYVLDEPVGPPRLRHAAVGTLVGLSLAAIVVTAVVLLRRTPRPRRR